MSAKSAARERQEALHAWHRILGMWKLCDKTACKHARACRGNVRACAPKYFHQLPQDVQDLFCTIAVSQQQGLTCEQLVARLEKAGLAEGFRLWHDGPAAAQ